MNTKERIKVCLRDRCNTEYDRSLNRLQRYFYTVKCIICIILNLEYKGEWMTLFNQVTVGRHSMNKWYDLEFGESFDWTDLLVGEGFTNWYYGEIEDGTP